MWFSPACVLRTQDWPQDMRVHCDGVEQRRPLSPTDLSVSRRA